MLTTKAFADLCDTTKKTIIHYDRIGLLKLNSKDDRGFRTYLPKQVLIFQKIQMLKSFGLSLSEIKKYLNHTSALTKLFDKQKQDLILKIKTLNKRVKKIDEFLLSLKTKKILVIPKIKTIPSYSFYAIDKVGRYVDIHPHQTDLFNKINDKTGKHIGITVFYELGYRPHHARMTTGAIIKTKKPKQYQGVNIVKVPRYKALTYTHIGPYSYLSYVWQFVDKYLKENKLKRHPKLAVREFYIYGPIGGASKDDCITELQIPIA